MLRALRIKSIIFSLFLQLCWGKRMMCLKHSISLDGGKKGYLILRYSVFEENCYCAVGFK